MAENIGIFPVNPTPAYKVQGLIYDRVVECVLDTGAAVTLIRKELWDSAKPPGAQLEKWSGKQLVGVEGSPLQVCGIAQVQLALGERPFQPQAVVADGLTADVILGLDFLEANRCTIDLGEKTLRFGDGKLSVPLGKPPQATPATIGLVMEKTMRVPA